MLTRLRAGQRDGRRQADDVGSFMAWVGETLVLFVDVSGPKFMKFWNSVGEHIFIS